MKTILLLYHDVVDDDDFDSSGFPGGDAHIYKLPLPEFERHLAAIHSAARGRPLLLTFDDGGSSAHQHTAGLLEEFGWRGHFFVTTNWIGKSGFLNPEQIRDLRKRGHRIGSHSCSHPPRMSYCTPEELHREWGHSIAVLADILGEKVEVASVPGGYYARNVAEAAAATGIRTLFTSEPQTATHVVNGCRVLGRYTIQQGVKPATAAAIAAGEFAPRVRQYAYWNAKKFVKWTGGTSWLRLRRWVLANR
jgi:peptidoglycan/xylan/chitin deacetylase (PgdA/CDA1 family)